MELLSTCPHKHYTNRTVSYLSKQTIHQWNCYLPVHTNTTPWNCYLHIHTNTTPMKLLATCPHKHYTNKTVVYLPTQTIHQWNCYLPVHTNTTPCNCHLHIHTNTTPMELSVPVHTNTTSIELSITCPHQYYTNGTVIYLSTQTLHRGTAT